jgi:hypothetical protein
LPLTDSLPVIVWLPLKVLPPDKLALVASAV